MKCNKIILIFAFIFFLPSAAFCLYHQLGVAPSSSDDSTFENSQGAATQIYTDNTQTFTGGDNDAHYFWVALNLKKSGAGSVFVQMGYHIDRNGGTMRPFVYMEHSNVTDDVFYVGYAYPLQDHTFYTFWFETDGVQNGDGTYTWSFWMWRSGIQDTKLLEIDLDSPNSMAAPYLFSEVAGSTSPCSDSFDITYGNGSGNNYALMAKKNSAWSKISHADARYFYESCSNNTDVSDISWQRHSTEMPETRTNYYGDQVW